MDFEAFYEGQPRPTVSPPYTNEHLKYEPSKMAGSFVSGSLPALEKILLAYSPEMA